MKRMKKVLNVVLILSLMVLATFSISTAKRSPERKFEAHLADMFQSMQKMTKCLFEEAEEEIKRSMEYLSSSIDDEFSDLTSATPVIKTMSSTTTSCLGNLKVSGDGKVEMAIPKVDNPSKTGAKNINVETVTNQKILCPNGKTEIKLCQIKETGDNYEQMISITAFIDPKRPKVMQVNTEVNFSAQTKGGYATSTSQMSRSNISQINIPDDFTADVADVEVKGEKLIIQLTRANNGKTSTVHPTPTQPESADEKNNK